MGLADLHETDADCCAMCDHYHYTEDCLLIQTTGHHGGYIPICRACALSLQEQLTPYLQRPEPPRMPSGRTFRRYPIERR